MNQCREITPDILSTLFRRDETSHFWIPRRLMLELPIVRLRPEYNEPAVDSYTERPDLFSRADVVRDSGPGRDYFIQATEINEDDWRALVEANLAGHPSEHYSYEYRTKEAAFIGMTDFFAARDPIYVFWASEKVFTPAANVETVMPVVRELTNTAGSYLISEDPLTIRIRESDEERAFDIPLAGFQTEIHNPAILPPLEESISGYYCSAYLRYAGVLLALGVLPEKFKSL